VDISAFTPVKDFVAVVDETLDAIKALPAADPSRELLIPGERGSRTYAERSANGVPLGGKVWASLAEEAAKAGVTVPELP
jgi:LDH2 family malate/lactate/ureidoglycolate dehydrogenase